MAPLFTLVNIKLAYVPFMKTITRSQITLVTITCLIVLAFIKVMFSDDKTAAGDVIGSEHVAQAYEEGSYPAQSSEIQNTVRIKKNAVAELSSASICGDGCQDQISKSLASNGLLSEDMIARIRENPAAFAEKLTTTPKTLSDLLSTLKADEEEDNGTQSAALAILKALSDEDKLSLAKMLTSYDHDQDRIIMGLELLELSLETQTGSIQTLNKVLETEGDPSVLSKAITITTNLPEGTEVQNTLHALTKIIQYNSSDHISGAALLAKVNLASNSNDLYDDISASLASFSSDKTEMGLTALQTALSRDDAAFASEGGWWYDDLYLRESVRDIAHNQEVSEETRSRANHLLNSYFSDD